MEELRHRAVIENVGPVIDGGEFAVKRIAGGTVDVTADIFADGHDIVNVRLFYKHDKERRYRHVPMKALVNDAWEGSFVAEKIGGYTFYIEAWTDYGLNWRHELIRKTDGGQHVAVELLDGIQYLDNVKSKDPETKAFIKDCMAAFRDPARYAEAVEKGSSERLKKIFNDHPYQTFPVKSPKYPVWTDRAKAGFSAWYEFFPRSSGHDPSVHGTFKDAAKRLPYVAEMGFDTVYFPPIHPIGEMNRKGKNNATAAADGDVGSPWAIGSALGGHKAINPALGTLRDFKAFIAEAKKLGIETAMDYALQCAPDHPYVKSHPGWFKWRPDGTVQYAENPPKKYQDILPFHFECEDWQNLWKELLSILMYWIDCGVTVFRVDNPHTKPFAFWKWAIAEVRKKHPEVIFLSEAFTRPKIMHRLAKAGFSHSYTYFTWRNSKEELSAYMEELTTDPSRQYFRPNFWPNTPDILPYELQQPNEATFALRFFLAATLSSNYGMYGPVYENMLFQAVPGKEEYTDSEKYEVVRHVWDTRGKLKTLIKTINQIRKHHPALQDTFNYMPCPTDNPQIMAWLKTDGKDSRILCAANFDPYHTQAATLRVPLEKAGLKEGESYAVTDLITQTTYGWQGARNYVELDPRGLPFHCFLIRS